MKEKNTPQSGYHIESILLTESSLSRKDNVVFDKNTKRGCQIKTGVAVHENRIIVEETVIVSSIVDNIEQFLIRVTMKGVFVCVGDTELQDYDKFGRINGAAIIFPYIREHITNLSLKAGLGPIILEPVNFAAVAKKKATTNKKN